jgi:hypothetical protein
MSPYNFDAERDLEFGESAREELRRIARLCREAGARLLLVNMPLSLEHGEFFGPGGWETYERRYRDLLPSVAQEIGADLLDLHDFSYAHEDFTDSHHLAPSGASRAASRICARIAEMMGQ